MRLNRRRRVEGELQVIVIGCSDDLCAPHHGVREYLIKKGIVQEILESNIHVIRVPGGIFCGEVIYPNDPGKAARMHADQIEQVRWLIEGKGATMCFHAGHNTCLGCESVGIETEQQRLRLVVRAREDHAQLGIETIVIFEEHHKDNHYEVLLEIPAIVKSSLEEAA